MRIKTKKKYAKDTTYNDFNKNLMFFFIFKKWDDLNEI